MPARNAAGSNGENVKVVQELMRHGSARITVDIYSQARNPAKRAAQQRILEMILPEERRELFIPALNDESVEHLDTVVCDLMGEKHIIAIGDFAAV